MISFAWLNRAKQTLYKSLVCFWLYMTFNGVASIRFIVQLSFIAYPFDRSNKPNYQVVSTVQHWLETIQCFPWTTKDNTLVQRATIKNESISVMMSWALPKNINLSSSLKVRMTWTIFRVWSAACIHVLVLMVMLEIYPHYKDPIHIILPFIHFENICSISGQKRTKILLIYLHMIYSYPHHK